MYNILYSHHLYTYIGEYIYIPIYFEFSAYIELPKAIRPHVRLVYRITYIIITRALPFRI